MKIALIVNPEAGGGKCGKRISEIKRKLTLNSIKYKIFTSFYHEHIVKTASEIPAARYDAIVSVGGDGTNFHTLNGLLKNFSPDQIPPLGIIPAGSGNSFAKDLQINGLDDGICSIVENNPRRVDVCSFTQAGKPFFFVNLAGFGFVTDVAKTAGRFKFLKDFSYIIGIFHRIASLSFHYMELEIDGKMIKAENCFVEFCNSRFTGGSMLMAPEARIDDGWMDIVVTGTLSRTDLLATLPKIFKGTHLRNPSVKHYRAKTAKIRTWPAKPLLPDGELFGTTPSKIDVHHKMIRYLCRKK